MKSTEHMRESLVRFQLEPRVNSLSEFILGPGALRHPGKNPDARAVHHFQRIARKAALGDELSAQILLTIAEGTVSMLAKAAREQPDLFRNMARKQVTWPTIWSNIPTVWHQVEDGLRTLGVGADTKNASKLRLPFDSSKAALIATKVAVYMGKVREAYQNHPDQRWLRVVRSLPPLDRNSAKVWWLLAAVEIKRSFPKLHLWLIGPSAQRHNRVFSEALRRVHASFMKLWRIEGDPVAQAQLPAPEDTDGLTDSAR